MSRLASVVNKCLPDRVASMQGTVDTSTVRRSTLLALLRLPDKTGDKLDAELHAALRSAYASSGVELAHDFVGDGVVSTIHITGDAMSATALTLDARVILITAVEMFDGTPKYTVQHKNGLWANMTYDELKALESSVPDSKVFNLNAVMRIIAKDMPDTAARAAVEVYLNSQVGEV